MKFRINYNIDAKSNFQFSINEKHIAFQKTANEIEILRDGEQFNLTIKNSKVLTLYKNFLIINSNDSISKIFRIEKSEIVQEIFWDEKYEVDLLQNLDNKYWRYKLKVSLLKSENGLFDYENNIFLGLHNNFFPTFINENYIFGKANNCILRYDIEANVLWEFLISNVANFTQFNEIKQTELLQYYGVYNNILWLQLNGDRLLGLNVDTGEQVHLIDNVSKGVGDNYLDVNLGIIKILAGHYYYEFDLNTLVTSKKILLDPEEKWFIRSCTFYKNDTNIYFCGHFDNWERTNAFGIYDSERNAIVWHQINGEHGVNYYNPPQANSNVFGILDNKGLLTLFDRN